MIQYPGLMRSRNQPRLSLTGALRLVSWSTLLAILAATFARADEVHPTTASRSAALRLVAQVGHSARVSNVSISVDGLLALTSSVDGTTRIWDVESGGETQKFPSGMVGALLTPDGKHVVLNGQTGIDICDLNSGKTVGTIGPRGSTESAFSLSG